MILRLLLKLIGRHRKRNVRGRGLGLLPSPKDKRDFKYSFVGALVLPPSAYLNGWTLKNQGKWNSCSAFSMCTAAEMLLKEVPFSERHNWFHTRRDYRKMFPENVGVHLRDALKVAQNIGLAPESLCPYTDDAINIVPNSFAESFARFFRIGEYSSCTGNAETCTALAEGHPVIIGMQIDEAFWKLSTLDYKPSGRALGGHAMVIYGYDKTGFLVVNSWGERWGKRGCFRLKYEDANRLLFERWALTRLKRRDEF